MAFLLDSLLLGGIRFVLGRVADAVDSELNDEDRMREELLAAQMQLELGEIDDEEFRRRESSLVARLHEIQRRKRATAAPSLADEPGAYRVTGAEASVEEGHEG